MSTHNSLTGSTETVSTSAKVGDTVKILGIDSITGDMYPELVGMEVKVTSLDSEGDVLFKYDKPLPKESIYARRNLTHLVMTSADGWKYRIVE